MRTQQVFGMKANSDIFYQFILSIVARVVFGVNTFDRFVAPSIAWPNCFGAYRLRSTITELTLKHCRVTRFLVNPINRLES